MAFWHSKRPEGLTKELIERVWDLGGRLEQLEDRLDAKLDDLSKRYRRAEQSEIRLEKKKASGDCADEEPSSDEHPAIVALKRRQKSAPSSRLNSRAG